MRAAAGQPSDTPAHSRGAAYNALIFGETFSAIILLFYCKLGLFVALMHEIYKSFLVGHLLYPPIQHKYENSDEILSLLEIGALILVLPHRSYVQVRIYYYLLFFIVLLSYFIFILCRRWN
jgi:hypothetical protein